MATTVVFFEGAIVFVCEVWDWRGVGGGVVFGRSDFLLQLTGKLTVQQPASFAIHARVP